MNDYSEVAIYANIQKRVKKKFEHEKVRSGASEIKAGGLVEDRLVSCIRSSLK